MSQTHEGWRVDRFGSDGGGTTLGTLEGSSDHAAIAPDGDGALLALAFLDRGDGSGVHGFAPGRAVTTLFGGDDAAVMSTAVVGSGDYFFVASPLVRFQRSTRKVTALGVDGVVQLAAAGSTLYFAEQSVASSGENGSRRPRWVLRSMPVDTTKSSQVASGEGVLYGLAASGDGIAWSTLDAPTLEAADRATGSVWFRRGKTTAPSRLARKLAFPMGVELDGTHVYVALRGGRGEPVLSGGVVRIPLAGVLALSLVDPSGPLLAPAA